MTYLFNKICFIGMGLIGSSMARAIRQNDLARRIVCYDTNKQHLAQSKALDIVDEAHDSLAPAVHHADLVVLCVPVGAYEAVCADLKPIFPENAVLTDVGSVKEMVAKTVDPDLPFVPAHPIAGTENSGPEAGFADLFKGRFCIITPTPSSPPGGADKVKALWDGIGSVTEIMTPDHHDKVLAITSHLPHLIAYTIVSTATDLADDLKQEVIRYSAGGFRDFTRIAASNPIMWRDIFLNNKDAVLDSLQRFNEDLTILQRAIRRGQGDVLEEWFARTRSIRQKVIDAGQAQD